jgi:hypothetical protein
MSLYILVGLLFFSSLLYSFWFSFHLNIIVTGYDVLIKCRSLVISNSALSRDVLNSNFDPKLENSEILP